MPAEPPDPSPRPIMHWRICKLPYVHYPNARTHLLDVEMSNSLSAQKKAVIDAVNRSQKCSIKGIADFDMVAEIRDSKRQNPLSLRAITKQCLHKERIVYYYPNGRIRAADYQPSTREMRLSREQEDLDTKIHAYIIKLYEIYDGLETLPANYVRDIAVRNMNAGRLPIHATFTSDEEKQVRRKCKGKPEASQLGNNMSDGMAGIISFVPIHTVPILTAVADRLRRAESAKNAKLAKSSKERHPDTKEPETMRLPDDPWTTILDPPKASDDAPSTRVGPPAKADASRARPGASGAPSASKAPEAPGTSGASGAPVLPPPPEPVSKTHYRYSADPAKVQPYSGLGVRELLPPSVGAGVPALGDETDLTAMELVKIEQLGFGRRLLGVEGDVKDVKRYLAFLAHQQETIMASLSRLTDALLTPPDPPSEPSSEHMQSSALSPEH